MLHDRYWLNWQVRNRPAYQFTHTRVARAGSYTGRVLELIGKGIGKAAMESSRPVYSKLNTPWP
jgi:hypothetical protein